MLGKAISDQGARRGGTPSRRASRQGRGFAAGNAGGEDGDRRDLVLIGVEADDPADLYLQPRLLQRLARGGGLGDLAALDEAAGEGPQPVSGLDGALDQDYPPVRSTMAPATSFGPR